MKLFLRNIMLILLACSMTGCSLFSWREEPPASELNVESILPKLQLGMTYDQMVDLVKVKPEVMQNGAAKFKLADGELWVRFSGTEGQLGEVIFWGTVATLPDGSTVKKTSKQQSMDRMLNNPICIDISITTMLGGQNRVGKCYYEQYGPGNILVEASEKGDKDKQVSLIFINNKYVLLKGKVPANSEFKYLAGYMANLQLIQRLIAKGMSEATPVEGGRRNFAFESNIEPLVIQTLQKKIIYPAPWDVKGFVEPSSNGQGFDFDINFSVTWKSAGKKSIQDTNFKGSFRQEEKHFGENIEPLKWKQFFMAAPATLKPLSEPKNNFSDLSL